MFKRIVAYGDSWTIGEGCNSMVESTLPIHEKIIYQKENSWVRFLSDKMNLIHLNNGVSGNSNNKIFNQIIIDVKNGLTTKKDLVTIMWSSSLRDSLPFMPHAPKEEWLSWSTKHLIEKPEKFFTSTRTENKYYDSFMEDYKKFFLTNLYTDSYYSILNQNYIIFLQKFLNHHGIRYFMMDGIENMLYFLDESYNKTDLIEKKYYWNYGLETARTFLEKKNRQDIWEYEDKWKERATQHPNTNGYILLSDEIHNFIISHL